MSVSSSTLIPAFRYVRDAPGDKIENWEFVPEIYIPSKKIIFNAKEVYYADKARNGLRARKVIQLTKEQVDRLVGMADLASRINRQKNELSQQKKSYTKLWKCQQTQLNMGLDHTRS